MRLIITDQQIKAIKRELQGDSPYQIARDLSVDPPSIYRSLKTGKRTLLKVKEILAELEALGFSEKINSNNNGE